MTLASLADMLARDPDRVRALMDVGPDLPDRDKFAQLTRALWSGGIVLDVPAGSGWNARS
ncbi:MAG: hypothetical protein WKF78_00640 [Candidatus Limnocylindrales bacterium]